MQVEKFVLKGLQWPLWLSEAWYSKGCIHRLANPRKRCASIVISMSVYLSVCLSLREDILGTTRFTFTKFLVHVAYGPGSILLRRRRRSLLSIINEKTAVYTHC